MPYYEGGPSGPLVLMIDISPEVSSQSLTQYSTDPTVAMSRPNAELAIVEDPSISPAHPDAPDKLEPTVPASQMSEYAPTVLATTAAQQVAAIPSVPKAMTYWKSWIIETLVGITIFGVTIYLYDLAILNVPSNSPLMNPIIPSWDGSSYWLTLISGLYLVVPFFFVARFGPLVGLCTAVIGSFLGDVISGYLASYSIDWYWYVAIAACGLFPGLAYRRSRGRNLSIRAAMLFSLLGMSIYYIIRTIGDSIIHTSLPALLLLLIALSVCNALGKNQIS
jgi:ECF-type riboflavin transporter, S component